ncbi:hypothetical protein FKP32DRAFT_1592331 [Trametes sanguinea]|nr:hypothetical protein FKP32DRAFT_1592331 [Trametes sanguinea]
MCMIAEHERGARAGDTAGASEIESRHGGPGRDRTLPAASLTTRPRGWNSSYVLCSHTRTASARTYLRRSTKPKPKPQPQPEPEPEPETVPWPQNECRC